MKYLFVFVVLLVAGSLALSPQPKPSCTPPKNVMTSYPIVVNEVQRFHLDEYFTGFNLEFSKSSDAPDFAYLTQKTDTVIKFDQKQPGLKSYHLDHNGNDWGSNLITLSEQGFVTKIRYGSATANDTIPKLTETITVQSEKAIVCFDAVWMRDQHLVIVDCIKSSTFGITNIFIYVNTTSQSILPRNLQNDMYVGFTVMTRRRMMILRENDYNYLIRAYYHDGVDQIHSKNTYLEILTFNDPFKPRTLKVMDRSYLHQDKLSITDFKLYMGNMYLLDYYSGVIIFDITSNQNIVITGRYRTDSGYTKLGVYSNNLDNHIIFALANKHAIYEIDFTNQLTPSTLAKYSIFSDAIVTQLWVNQQYVITQVTANLTTSTNDTFWYNSTLVFSRGTRSYLNAYQVYEHASTNVIIDFQRTKNLLLIMEQNYTVVNQINQAVLTLYPTSAKQLNKPYPFHINAKSVNEYEGRSLECSWSIQFTIVDKNNMTMWPTGLTLPQTYYANYPGNLFIPLNRYVVGPNVTYDVHETVHPNMSNYWVLQQNQTILHWQKQPSLGKITFLRQEQYDSVSQADLYIYTQDIMNITHFVKCTATKYIPTIKCNGSGYVPQAKYRINNLTANRWHQYGGNYQHLVAVTYQGFPNQVFVYILEKATLQMTKPLLFSAEPYEGQVTNIQFVGHFLAVLFRYSKQIKFFDMQACLDHQQKQCTQLFTIDAAFMAKLGVDYFSPIQILTSDFHPGVLFIQNLDKVTIIQVSRKGAVLLATISSPGSKEPGFHKYKIGISEEQLVLVNPPSLIQQHTLKFLYTRRTADLDKVYPLYNYTIPDNFDLDSSDSSSLVFITAVDKNLPAQKSSVILVYRTGYPAVASFYDVFHLQWSYSQLLIDATGQFQDYVAVAKGSMLQIFRQYQVPVLIFEDSFNDFDFNVTYSNDPDGHAKYLAHANVKVANYPQEIVINDSRLNNNKFLTQQIDYQDNARTYILNDSTWFNGTVINYTITGCSECGNKIKVINHLEHKRDFHAQMDMDDYIFTAEGGLVQQYQSVLTMQHNGSIGQVVGLPAVNDGENCMHVTYSWMYDFGISACGTSDQVFLYMNSLVPDKPFVLGPYASSAKRVGGLQTVGDLLVVVDVDEQPSILSREGGVLIYSINHEISQPQIFDEIDFIDTDDLASANNWNHDDQIFIANAYMVYTNATDLYRLAITELRYGIFFVDFRWKRGQRELQIVKVQFIDLKQELFNVHMPMPNVAYFEGVTVSNFFYDTTWKYYQVELIITTRNFHIFQLNCGFDKSGSLTKHQIARVFKRYGYYETTNYIKTFDGYFAVVQKLPIAYQPFSWLSRQVLTVYDTTQKWRPFAQDQQFVGDLPVYRMLGGYPFTQKGRVTFDFNFTFSRNSSDPFRDIGLLVLHSSQAVIRDFLIHDFIAIQTEAGISSTQDAKLVAWNDYNSVSLPLSIVIDNGGESGLPGWAIALIVIGSLVVAGLGGFVGWRLYLKSKAVAEEEPVKKSLLEEEGEKDDEGEDDDDDDEDYDDEEDDQQQDEENKNNPLSTPAPENKVSGASINRDTLESVDEPETTPTTKIQQIPQVPEQEAEQSNQGNGDVPPPPPPPPANGE